MSSEQYQLQITITMNSEAAINPFFAAAFALGIGVIVLVAHSLIRKQGEIMKEMRQSIKIKR